MRYTYCYTTNFAANKMKYTLVFMQTVRCFLSVLTILRFTRQIYIKVANTEFHVIPSSEDNADICGQMDIMKQIYAFHVHTNAPKNRIITVMCL